ncbi:uncharacterized protein LOC128076015 isoform X2 [Tympanuchus pallidicinctus]|uniref:uncharacterized protein LOC128076015 isoform X2 n=1 Tax=Tympanuchus pallidicinctus TaxID=109042 RepID=UPI0022871C79|nr:uncharacterized protein LOC128076015 isoform X2 [Tympanuchus pallidicinctus]
MQRQSPGAEPPVCDVQRAKEAAGPFLGFSSSVPCCWPQRRAARWAQGAPSRRRPVPCSPLLIPCATPLPAAQVPLWNLAHVTAVTLVTATPPGALVSERAGQVAAMSSTKRARVEESVVIYGKRELGAPEPKRRRGPTMTIKQRRERRKGARFHRARASAVSDHGEPMEVDPPPEEPMEVDPPAAQLAWHHTTVPGPVLARSQLRHRWSGRSAPYPLRGPRPRH